MELIHNYSVVHVSLFGSRLLSLHNFYLKKLTAYPHQHSIIVLLYTMCLEIAHFHDIAIYLIFMR